MLTLQEMILTSAHKRGCRVRLRRPLRGRVGATLAVALIPKFVPMGRSPLPEREVSSHSPFPQNGPEARQRNYEWMSDVFIDRTVQVWHAG